MKNRIILALLAVLAACFPAIAQQPLREYAKGTTIELAAAGGSVTGAIVGVKISDADIVATLNAQGEGDSLAFTLDDSTTAIPFYTVRADWPRTIDGAWTWYSRPESVHTGNITYWFPVSQLGEVTVCAYNHATETYTETVLETITTGVGSGRDDHNNGAGLVLASGKVCVFYSDHGGAILKMRKQTTLGDPTAWDAAVSLGGTASTTYSNPIQLSSTAGDDGGDIYNFYRDESVGGSYERQYKKSTDAGATWAAAVNLFKSEDNANRESNPQRPYMHAVASRDGTKIHFLLSDGNPPEVTDPTTAAFVNSCYHAYFDTATGNLHKTDGTVVAGGTFAAPPTGGFDTALLTRVLDGSTRQLPYWNWDIQMDANDRPVLACVKFNGDVATPYTEGTYTISRYNGSAWITVEIDPFTLFGANGTPIANVGTQPYYYGGICLDPDDPTGVAYVSNHDPDGGEKAWSIWKIVSADGGDTWTVSQKMNTTRGGERRCIRPIVPRDAHADLQLIWMEGHYNDFQGTYPDDGLGGYDHNMFATGIQTYPRLVDGYVAWLKTNVSAAAKTVHMYWDDADATDLSDHATVFAGWAHASQDVHVNRWKNDPIDIGGNTAFTTVHMMRWSRATFPAGEQHIYSSNWSTAAAAAQARLLARATAVGSENFAQLFDTTSGTFGAAAVATSPTAQVWFTYAVGWNNATNSSTRPYFNGTALAAIVCSAAAMPATTSPAPFWYGASPHTAAAHGYWRGEIGLVGVVDTELSANAIDALSDSNPFVDTWTYGTYGDTATFTVLEANVIGDSGSGEYRTITVMWESDASGVATVALTDQQTMTGEFISADFWPEADAYQPTDNYDVTVTTSTGHDILLANGANLDNVASETKYPLVGTEPVRFILANDPLTINVTNAGAGNRGTVRLKFKQAA